MLELLDFAAEYTPEFAVVANHGKMREAAAKAAAALRAGEKVLWTPKMGTEHLPEPVMLKVSLSAFDKRSGQDAALLAAFGSGGGQSRNEAAARVMRDVGGAFFASSCIWLDSAECAMHRLQEQE